MPHARGESNYLMYYALCISLSYNMQINAIMQPEVNKRWATFMASIDAYNSMLVCWAKATELCQMYCESLQKHAKDQGVYESNLVAKRPVTGNGRLEAQMPQ